MFEKFVNGKINSEYDIINNLDNISREGILRSNLSDFTKKYLTNEFENYSEPDEIKDKISKSNKLYFNYAIRPKWTLLTFLFNNFESRSPNEILKKLNYFPFYKFYSDSIRNFIDESMPIFVTKADILKIIDDTNSAIYEKLTNEISNLKIKNFFLQIFLLKYENESKYNLDSSIHYSFIKIFLEDKSYTSLENKFSKVKDLSEESEINLKDIIKILTDKYTVNEKVTEEITFPVNKESKESSEVKKESPEIIIKDVEPDKKNVIYSKELIKADAEKSEKLTFEVITKTEPTDVIRKLFDDKQTDKILKKIYQSDLRSKENSFEKLEKCKSWTEAAQHLKGIFKNNNVDIYNKDVVSFVNILNEYFKRTE